MLNKLPALIQNKRIALLGFGLEGQSSFRFLFKHFSKHNFIVADQNPKIKSHPLLTQKNVEISTGTDYLNTISVDDFVIKSPGIKLPKDCKLKRDTIFSQTDLFIQNFNQQIIGITGTKGKSTTASLLFKILSDQGRKAILIGNIGKPAMDYWDKIDKDTYIIYELSAHQLEFVRFSPKYSILLNLYPEHLDYFKTKENYFKAKLNIAKFQTESDFFFCDKNETLANTELSIKPNESKFTIIENKIKLKENSKTLIDIDEMIYLKGLHQFKNCIPLLDLSRELNLNEDLTLKTIKTFKPLPHRIEFIGKVKNVSFYNDSISTIPEATIEALKALKRVEYLILGGLDRTLNYQKLYAFLENYPLIAIYFIGPAGKRMYSELSSNLKFQKNYINKLNQFESYLSEIIHQNNDSICLLSPAAASYDEFENFEARGNFYRSLVEKFM